MLTIAFTVILVLVVVERRDAAQQDSTAPDCGQPINSNSECVDKISVRGDGGPSSCFLSQSSAITVEFQRCFPNETDWIAMYNAEFVSATGPNNDYIRWNWLCGSSPCDKDSLPPLGVPLHGGFRIPSDTVEPGLYQLFLLTEVQGLGRTAVASSTPFQVSDECGS